MQEPRTTGFGAKCAIHLERMATRTCARCGNFACEECTNQGQETQCPPCRALTGGEAFPFTRTNFSFDGIWNFAFERWKQEWVILSVCLLILMAVGMVSALFSSIFQGIAGAIVGDRGGVSTVVAVTVISTVLSQLVTLVAQGPFLLGLIRIMIDVLNGKKADVGRILTQLPKLGRYILQMLAIWVMVVVPLAAYFLALAVAAAMVAGVSLGEPGDWEHGLRGGGGIAVIALGSLALIPVLIYVAIPLTFANMELVYGDCSPVESIRRSFQIANGFRLSIFGFALIAGLVGLVGLVACCVGVIPAWSLGYLLLVGLYLALRKGSGVAPPVES